MSGIIVAGDLHSEWKTLNAMIAAEQPEIILQTGDFGYWPRLRVRSMKKSSYQSLHGFSSPLSQIRPFSASRIANRDTKIYFCPGNHEDWDSLDKLKNNEIAPNIFYMKKGSMLMLPDGRQVLFMGGAESVDKYLRKPKFDWFKQELITDSDMENLPSSDTRIDIVISHTAPLEFVLQEKSISSPQNTTDPSRVYLSRILAAYHPREWYFGHWHLYRNGIYQQCRWTCLNQCHSKDWWVRI